jgi:hypothetical protein
MSAMRATVAKWVAFMFACSVTAFLLFSVFAGAGAAQAPQPQPELGRTFFVTVYGRSHNTSGYVKPWIGRTYNWMLPIAEAELGIVAIAALVGLCLRAIKARKR